MTTYVRVALGHLDVRIIQPHHAAPDFGDDRLGDDEGFAIPVVETLRYIARQLDVLSLVVADRHFVRAVQQNVARHQHRVVEQTGGDAHHSGGLVFVLRHALKPADGGYAVEQPARLGVRGNVALDEQRALVRVDSAGEQYGRELASLSSQLVGVNVHSDRVQVNDGEEVLFLVLTLDPAFEGADVVAELRVAARLNAAKDPAAGS